MKLKARPTIIVLVTEILFLAITWIIFSTYTYNTIPDLRPDIIDISRYYPCLNTDKVKYGEIVTNNTPIELNQSDFNAAAKDLHKIQLLVTWPERNNKVRIILWGMLDNTKNKIKLDYIHSSVIEADLSKSIKKSNFTISTRKVKEVKYNVREHKLIITYVKDLSSGCWYLLIWSVLCCAAILIPLWVKVNGGQ